MLNIQYLNIITILLDSNHVKACIRFWQDYMTIYYTQKNLKKEEVREKLEQSLTITWRTIELAKLTNYV